MTAPRTVALGSALALSALSGCQDRDVSVQLRSLAKSGDVSYVCRDAATGRGVALSECHRNSLANGSRDLIALVTQTSTGEIALVNVPREPQDLASDEGVIDVDPSTPGFGFLRVGARPEDVISTPDGEASFVSSANFGKPGLFALPTTCLGPPSPQQSIRDLTTWAACRLPSPPGQMELVFEKNQDGAAGACAVPDAVNVDERECPANLVERDPSGRWKLLVTLPDAGSVAVLDAQGLLDQEPGAFPSCDIQETYALSVDLPSTPLQQSVPDDLMMCTTSAPPARPAPPAYAPRPSDIALADGVLYVSDAQAPVIHRLDISRPCSASEMPPLLPMSFDDPDEVVTTSKIAVSPLTPKGKRFVYAVDRQDSPMSSLMVFDVSPGSSDRTPLVRPGSADLPGETADRLRFGAAIRDVSFILRDRPKPDPDTGVAQIGQACNPNPGGAGAEYQIELNSTDDVDPADLRGVFGMVLLSNGQVSVVDVEDFDAPCRRPASLNPSSEADFRGCANDQPENVANLASVGPEMDMKPVYVDKATGKLTVTNEVSCRMVVPHYVRSAYFGVTSDNRGIRAPSLTSFPQLALPENELGRSVADRPKLLAVDFPVVGDTEQPAQVYVGTALYRRRIGEATNTDLVIDPGEAQQHSVALPLVEPRAYTGEELSLAYEGVVAGGTNGNFYVDAEVGPLTMADPTSGFCDRGVNDVELMRELGARRFELAGTNLEEFARAHADSLWITDDFPEEDSPYWSLTKRTPDTAPGCTCTQTRATCESTFGEYDEDEPDPERQFRIEDARQDRLLLSGAASACDTKCCFPSGTQYEIRSSKHWVFSGSGSGVRHDVVVSAETTTLPSGERVRNCVRDCNPRKRWDDPRVFEITCPEGVTPEACAAGAPDAPAAPGAPPVSAAAEPCVLADQPGIGLLRPTGVLQSEAAARCIYSTPTARFAVYRGLRSSARGMRFAWAVQGAFQSLGFDLAVLSSAVSPTSFAVLPDLDWLTVVDSASLGLVTVDMDDELRVLTPTIN